VLASAPATWGLFVADEAEGIIELLRQAAQAVKDLVADNERLRKENLDLTMQLDGMEEEWVTHSCKEDIFGEWEALLLDFRSGLRDEGELLEGTVGRR
jgi:hypothetical protein